MKSRRPRTRRSLRLENLETRKLMAGDVSVDLDDGNLEIEGDHQANSISVFQYGDDDWAVVGNYKDGAPTLINGKSFVTFSNVTGDLEIDLEGGNDKLELYDNYSDGFTDIDDIFIELGSGNDEATIHSLDVNDDFVLDAGNGNDEVFMQNMDIGDKLFIEMENGGDDLSLNYVNAARAFLHGNEDDDTTDGDYDTLSMHSSFFDQLDYDGFSDISYSYGYFYYYTPYSRV